MAKLVRGREKPQLKKFVQKYPMQPDRSPILEETRIKLSKSLKGKIPWNKGKKYNVDNGWQGKKHSEETLAKMSNSAKNRPPISDETRAKLSAAAKARYQTSKESNQQLV